eukprot:355002-Chlamydomonas_euryale.AAC.3
MADLYQIGSQYAHLICPRGLPSAKSSYEGTAPPFDVSPHYWTSASLPADIFTYGKVTMKESLERMYKVGARSQHT